MYLAAVYGLLDSREEAAVALTEANRLRAQNGWGMLTNLAVAHDYFRWPGDRSLLKQGLIAAGMPVGGEWYSRIAYREVGAISLVEGVTTLYSAAEAMELHQRGAVFVDTRGSWAVGHIPGSHFLEWWGEGWLFNEASLAQFAGHDQEIVIYTIDNTSKLVAEAAALAVSRGFTRVYQFPGGLHEWKAAGYPVDKPG